MKLSPNDGSIIGDVQFPRTDTLPVQSPKYWVGQKDRYLRQLLIRDIEKLTGRRLIVYFANRFIEGSGIEAGDISFFVELLTDIEPGEPVDLLIETGGGVTDATEAIVSLLQNTFTDLRVVVANAAKSNGTLICLAAREIVMGPPSQLGPIDPSLNNIPCTILAQEDFASINYPLHQLGILALRQTRKLAETLLANGMMKGAEPTEIERVALALGSRDTYFSHGSTIDHREAAQLGLKVLALTAEDSVWQRIWLLYNMYYFDVRRDGYLKIFEGHGRSTAVSAQGTGA